MNTNNMAGMITTTTIIEYEAALRRAVEHRDQRNNRDRPTVSSLAWQRRINRHATGM